MNKKLRLGCIGTGGICNYAHIPTYVTLDSLELVAVYDTDRLAAEQAREKYISLAGGAEVIICESAEELFGMVDIVDICTPVRWHAYYAAMALERNVHVMSEKPMARTWLEANHVAELSHQSKALYQLNDDNIFIPRYLALRTVVESGMIGDVQNVWIARGTPSSDRKPWFYNAVDDGGGAIMDYGSHATASTWFLIGYDKVPVEVRSLGIGVKERTRLVDGRIQRIEVDDDAHFKVLYRDHKNGDWINVVIEATWTWPHLGRLSSDVHGYIEIEGSEGTVTGCVDDQERDFLLIRHRTFGERTIPVKTVHSEDESFKGEMTNFVMSIRHGVKSMLNADVGAGIIGILNCAQLSELEGRRSITMEEMKKFCRETAGDSPDPWKAGDLISAALNKPYRDK